MQYHNQYLCHGLGQRKNYVFVCFPKLLVKEKKIGMCHAFSLKIANSKHHVHSFNGGRTGTLIHPVINLETKFMCKWQMLRFLNV